MISIKPPKTFDEQIEILKSRGLMIEDEEYAKFILSNVNYYRFTAYLLPFKNEDDTYKEGITFKKISLIYNFDRELRALLIEILSSIEISFRTYIAYTIAMNHGALGYLQRNNFKDEKYHKDFLFSLEKEKLNNSNKLFIKHHNEKYDGKLPIWVATEIMPFGMLSKLYSNMLPQDTTYIKNNLCKVNPTLVNSWLQSLTHIRNQCAHYGRIYNSIFPIIKIKKQDKQYNLNPNRIFTYIVAMNYLMADRIAWNKFFIKLQGIINDYSSYIDLELIGFPNNWVEILSKF
ncbi:Abi family protein [uncultured Clostridium sp.]|uniref:Abi family protein n=1 Tax=uncultured Clostridium sp. TaxID=59620 RepID=UPI0025CB8277|nr:Abi family protein [uncultured Clostridium sp.]